MRGIAKVAASALEDAIVSRLKPGSSCVVRSDNGLVFGSKAFTQVIQEHGLEQEYITPYTPEQNGMIERWFRSLKEECVWVNDFKSWQEAHDKIENWIEHYNSSRPHSALGYLTPVGFAQKLVA